LVLDAIQCTCADHDACLPPGVACPKLSIQQNHISDAATGMNSATTMLLALVPAGGHIITTTDCYRRTRQFIQTVLPKMGISATVIDPSDMEVQPCSHHTHIPNAEKLFSACTLS
jgi:cystathionine beta-lyase/cystathionine gamma-synthase